MTLAEVRRTGTGTAMPVRKVRITFEALGYPEWWAEVRTNPRSSVYNDLVQVGEDFWGALASVVLAWNLCDEDGVPFPLPREVASEQELDLPVRVMSFLFERYIDEVRSAAGLPKVSEPVSGSTSTTSSTPQERA